MGDFKMGSKTIMSQSGTSNPTWGANAPIGAQVSYNYHLKNDIQTITNSSSNTSHKN